MFYYFQSISIKEITNSFLRFSLLEIRVLIPYDSESNMVNIRTNDKIPTRKISLYSIEILLNKSNLSFSFLPRFVQNYEIQLNVHYDHLFLQLLS